MMVVFRRFDRVHTLSSYYNISPLQGDVGGCLNEIGLAPYPVLYRPVGAKNSKP